MFADDFNRADETLEDSANWTNITPARDRLQVLGNQLASQGTLTSATAYEAPANGGADMYAQADVPNFTGRSIGEVLCVRLVDRDNWIGIGVTANGITQCIKKVAGSDTTLATSDQNFSTSAVRIEISGTTVSAKRNLGSGFVEFFSGTVSDAVFNGETSAGFRCIAAGGVDGVVVWDNFETGDVGSTSNTVSMFQTGNLNSFIRPI